jgi:hypothetical protein
MVGSAFVRAQPSRPAGWHDDPQVAGLERWFNGAAWTDMTRDAPNRKDDSCTCC